MTDGVLGKPGQCTDKLAGAHASFGKPIWLLPHPGHGPPVDLGDVGQSFFLGLGDAVLVGPLLEIDLERVREVHPVHRVLGMDSGERTVLDDSFVQDHVGPLVLNGVVCLLAGFSPGLVTSQSTVLGFFQFQAHDPTPFGTGSNE